MVFFVSLVLIASAAILGGLGVVMIAEGLRRRADGSQLEFDYPGHDGATLLSPAEGVRLRDALRRNVDEGTALVMDHRTTFAGTALCEEDETQTINRIKSIPTHY